MCIFSEIGSFLPRDPGVVAALIGASDKEPRSRSRAGGQTTGLCAGPHWSRWLFLCGPGFLLVIIDGNIFCFLRSRERLAPPIGTSNKLAPGLIINARAGGLRECLGQSMGPSYLFFTYPNETRKIIYATNAIALVKYSLRGDASSHTPILLVPWLLGSSAPVFSSPVLFTDFFLFRTGDSVCRGWQRLD